MKQKKEINIFNPYIILGISKSVTQDEIKNAYRKMAKKYHPDLNPNNPEAEKKFAEIANAYDLLETPKKREKFDKGEFEFPRDSRFYGGAHGPFYHESKNEGGRYTFSFKGDESELFNSMFKNFNAGTREEFNVHGEDQFFRMEIEFKDSILGAEREITFPPNKRFNVKIPAGIESGKKLRFSGQGLPGKGKGAAGDSYIEIQVKPSSVFKRVGNDLELELSVSLSEAILGGEVEIPTVEKPIKLKIPPGANTDQRLRVKNKGVVDAALKTRGNLIVILKVVLPPKVDDELKEMMQKWSQNHAYNPRQKPLEQEGM